MDATKLIRIAGGALKVAKKVASFGSRHTIFPAHTVQWSGSAVHLLVRQGVARCIVQITSHLRRWSYKLVHILVHAGSSCTIVDPPYAPNLRRRCMRGD
jgi:hypothetical protein